MITSATPTLTFRPLSLETWLSFKRLFGERGACGGCWCMNWRLRSSEYEANKGGGNEKLMKALVAEGKPLGILAFSKSEPIGWCAIAPREDYIRLQTSRILKPIDDAPVWSISCFFIRKDYRQRGVSVPLLKAAVNYAVENKATIIEGYPHYPKKDKMPDVFAWTGLAVTFEKAGFMQVARPSQARAIFRYFNT